MSSNGSSIIPIATGGAGFFAVADVIANPEGWTAAGVASLMLASVAIIKAIEQAIKTIEQAIKTYFEMRLKYRDAKSDPDPEDPPSKEGIETRPGS